MADERPRAIFHFEGFRLDLGRARLLDLAGAELVLRHKSFEVLRYLVEHPDQIVSRDELLEAVWPGVFVNDDSITQCVAEVRRALGDAGLRLLRTVPKRGYLFAAEVERGEPAPAPPGRERGGAPAPTGGEPATAAPTEAAGAAERRHLTVLCCDLVDSTALSARLDPEELQGLLADYRHRVAEAVGNEDGHVAGCVGDGVFAYFGWPRAHEDDAERAIRAGLAATAATAALGTGAGAEPLAARVGIATGLVVVGGAAGGGGARGRDAVGEAPNLAARLQTLAEPGGVVLDAATRRLAGGLFDYVDLGEAALKGFAAPVRAWRALGEAAPGSRFEALRGAGGGHAAPPLVGRNEELELLLRRWRQAAGGEGRMVLLSGEPGIGKSRLAAALGDALVAEGALHQRLSWYCSPQHTGSVLHPVAAWLGRAAGFARGDSHAERAAKLKALLAPDDPAPEGVALLAELLGLPADVGRHLTAPPDLSPQRRRERTLAALLRRVEALSRRRPLLAVVEDAHWADPTTRELLDLLVARVEGLPVLLVVTHRPEFQAPWVGQAHVTTILLNRLGRSDSAALLARVAGAKALPPEVEEEILARTDGVPLFVEEVAKAVLEGGLLREEADRWVPQGPLPPPTAVPATLQASLLARLDRLGPAMEVAQVGAAIGREFPYELLAAVARRPDPELREGLDRLVGASLVHARGTPPDAVYSFKHALVRDAAYGTLLRAKRRALHADIAGALERLSFDGAGARPELLAQHFDQAGMTEEAVARYAEAGRGAVARSATAEAATHLRRALDLLSALPDTPARWRQELDLQTDLGNALAASEGYIAPGAIRAHARARALCERLGDAPGLVQVAWGQWDAHYTRAEIGRALEVAEALMRFAEREDSFEARLTAHRLVGTSLLQAGRLQEARRHLEMAAGLLDEASSREGRMASVLVHDALVAVPAYRAQILLYLGHYEQAKAQNALSLAQAERLARPHRRAVTLALSSLFYTMLKEDAPHLLDTLEDLAADQGFQYWAGYALMLRGVTLAWAGKVREGMTLLRRGAARHDAAGAAWAPKFLAMVAEPVGGGEGLALVGEAFARYAGTEARILVPELHRIRGVLLAGEGDAVGAEADFVKALDLAREQEARHWELRAATGLARLWRDQGRRVEARDLLTPAYGWFTEGFGLPDLREAKALLDQLA